MEEIAVRTALIDFYKALQTPNNSSSAIVPHYAQQDLRTHLEEQLQAVNNALDDLELISSKGDAWHKAHLKHLHDYLMLQSKTFDKALADFNGSLVHAVMLAKLVRQQHINDFEHYLQTLR